MKERAAQTSGLVSQISFFFFYGGRRWMEVVIHQLLRCTVVSPKEFVPSSILFVFLVFFPRRWCHLRRSSCIIPCLKGCRLTFAPAAARWIHFAHSQSTGEVEESQSQCARWESSCRPLEASPRIKMSHFLPPQFELRLVKSLVVRFGAARVIYSWGWWIVSRVAGQFVEEGRGGDLEDCPRGLGHNGINYFPL